MIWTSIRRSFIAVLSIYILVGMSVAFAQTGNTSVHGTITDPKGSTVPGAKVALSDAELGINLETTTNKDGVYQFVEIRPGTYELTVTAPGFATVHQTRMQLLVATPTTSDIQLQIASGTTTVEVVGSTQMINTQDATIGTAFGQTQIASLPFEGRDPAGILSLQPGVVTVSDRGKVDTNGDSRGGSVNGARSDQTNITLDGIGDNDEVAGTAFQGALRATLDSIEEFRVTTTNSDADQGRSSGAQVQLITKSGTNQFHGTGYEYNRPTNMVANDYFNKHAELQNDEPNIPPRLLRNTFGGSFGGPILKDKLFIFLAYEGQRTRESFQVTRSVPSDTLREGIIQYACAGGTTACPGGAMQVTGIDPTALPALTPKTYTVNVQPGFNALGASQIASMDPNCSGLGTCPWGPGVDPNVLQTLSQYPHANSDQLGDGVNYRAFTFSAGTPSKLDTYISRIDYNLTKNQTIFVRGGLQNDHGVPTSTPGDAVGTNSGAPQFPGQPDSTVATNNTKGIVVGYQWTISPTKVNSLHYGYIRQGLGVNGSAFDSFARLRGLDTTTSQNRSTTTIVPVHNITDDFSWTRGNHTFQFGGNYRLITNNNSTNSNSFSDSITNTGFLIPTGISNVGGTLDPAAFGFPAVDSGFQNSYDYPMMALAGIQTETDTVYVQDKSGNFLPAGAFVNRSYRDNEVEFYFKDSWRIKSNLTINAGLRYSLLQPPYERNGNQVCPSFSLDNFFQTRMKDMVQGVSYNPDFNMELCGPANGKSGAWAWDYKDIAPRLSMAWSPGYKDGLLGALFGGPGKSSVRMGAGIYYDHFGQGVITTYDQQGSFGFISNSTFPPGTVTLDNAPRYTGEHNLPPSLLFPAPTPGFPVTPPDAFSIYWGLDDKLKTPYSYAFDFSFSRELKSGFTLELAYVGRLGRRLLQEKDLAQPLNLFDPNNGVSYFQAVTALAKVYRQGVSTQAFNPATLPANIQAYWAYIMQPLQAGGAYQVSSCTGSAGAGKPNVLGTTNPVVAAYDLFCGGSLNETTPLSVWDTSGIPDNNLAGVSYFPKNGPYSFYQAQDASLFAWTSGGRSNYNALQVMIHHRATHGLTMDFNYSFSKSIDETSDAERVSLFQGSFFGTGEIYNPFNPGQFRAVSDYDMTHQFNMNWVYELPFGRNHAMGANWNRAANAVLGGWSWSGLGRWTSGLPFSVQNGFQFPTNWELNGVANLVGTKPQTGAFTDAQGDMNEFKNVTTALSSFDYPFPGGVGSRNVLRGPGYFGFDMALRKEWSFTERQKLAFSWEVFNVTNSVRFDVFSALPAIDNSGSFGKYSQTLTGPRVMEFMLRYSF
jgi:Carboxypeptidase regulatory-like domain